MTIASAAVADDTGTRAMRPGPLLQRSAALWLLAALIGQWLFAWYLLAHYGGTLLAGAPQAWAQTSVIGHVPGDTVGNLVFVSHIAVAAVISFGGVLQLVPVLRRRAPALHRYNGRVFMVAAVIAAVGGLHLTWVRGAFTAGAVGTSLNALVLLWFIAAAFLFALRRDIPRHRRWALRAFIAASGVWFFRVMLFGWILVNQGPLGVGENFDGPAVWTISFASFLLPLLILEVYFRVERLPGGWYRGAGSAALMVCAAATAVGTLGAFMMSWKPFL